MMTTLNVSKYINTTPLKELASSLRSHAIDMEEDEPQRKRKNLALKSKGKIKKAKAFQDEEERASEEYSYEEYEMSILSRRVNQL